MNESTRIQIECEPPHYIACECCGENITRLTRFVYQNHNAFAYYYGEIEPNKHSNFIKCLVVICEFDDNNEIIYKVGFPMMLWDNQDVVVTTLLNADEVAWQTIADVKILNRKNALVHHYKADVFRISDEILKQDKEIMNFFGE